MNRDAAELFAVQVLGWLAEDHARIGAFLAWSGESAGSLRERANDPAFLLAVIEFLMMDEASLLEACQALDVRPETPQQARAALPGGEDVHWT